MFDTFPATLLANVLALLIGGVTYLTIWSVLRRLAKRYKSLPSFAWNILSLWVRFLVLVLKRNRSMSEYSAWSYTERVRKQVFGLVSEGPNAKRVVTERSYRSMKNLASAAQQFAFRSPLDQLIEAAEELSFRDLRTPAKSKLHLSSRDKATWLTSQPIGDLAKWALRLSKDDRDAWLSWLESSATLIELEAAFTDDTNVAKELDEK